MLQAGGSLHHSDIVHVCVVQVVVSHVVGRADGVLVVHLQQSDELVQLEQMLDRLDDVYSASDDEAADNAVTYRHGDAVAVCVATIWQRATVLSDTVSADTTMKVQCVDYGSIHEVDVSKVRPLRAELMSEPAFAFDCQLFGIVADTGLMISLSPVVLMIILSHVLLMIILSRVLL